MPEKTYRADLHIHTILSPCGDLAMSPAVIIQEAKKKELQIIGITDHNTTLQAPLIQRLGKERGVFVMIGAEVCSKEEVHCLCFVPDETSRKQFQNYLNEHLPDIRNDINKFGYQVCVNEAEEIIYEEDRSLLSAINQSIEQIEQTVHQLGGIFIPAHINRPSYSIISQLGFIPPDLNVDALEISRHSSISDFKSSNSYLKNYPFIQSSDAHYRNDIGSAFTLLELSELSFSTIKNALKNC
ncbi:MAG: PHP domain-containing protein [Salinivirgaceae bacterium]